MICIEWKAVITNTNNICNCSPIWRKNIIHRDNNYFDEEKYGCYADLAVWLKGGLQKYIYKQTDYVVGFYIHEGQLHRRQNNDINILKEFEIFIQTLISLVGD